MTRVIYNILSLILELRLLALTISNWTLSFTLIACINIENLNWYKAKQYEAWKMTHSNNSGPNQFILNTSSTCAKLNFSWMAADLVKLVTMKVTVAGGVGGGGRRPSLCTSPHTASSASSAIPFNLTVHRILDGNWCVSLQRAPLLEQRASRRLTTMRNAICGIPKSATSVRET